MNKFISGTDRVYENLLSPKCLKFGLDLRGSEFLYDSFPFTIDPLRERGDTEIKDLFEREECLRLSLNFAIVGGGLRYLILQARISLQ